MQILIFLILAAFLKESTAEDTLVLVHSIFRHGERTPDEQSLLPTDPYINYNFAPFGLGQLTNEGKLTLYKLGVKLRDRYDQFLGPLYNPEIVYSRSTDMDRTKVSLKQMLAGLFPPNDALNWNPDLPWQPIPTNYEKLNEDRIMFPLGNSEYLQLFQDFMKSQFFQKFQNQYKIVYDYIEQNANIENANFMSAVNLYFSLTTENETGLALPEWTKNIFPEPLKTIAGQFYITTSGTTELLKYSSGFLLRKILDDSRARQNGTLEPAGRKMFIYSGHEINVANMLILLENFKAHVPAYGSCVLFELHVINGEYGFKVFYKEKVDFEPKLLTLSNCGSFCPLDKFAFLYSKYL